MDLHLLPLVRRQGQDQAELPGLHLATAPRRPARGRQPDRLILYLTLEGSAPLPPDQQDQLLKRLAEAYYKSPGSVTAALRLVIEMLNQFLLDRNLRGASSGRQSLGLFTAITLREARLYMAQCGPVHAYLSAPAGVRHIYDPQPARRGLGLGRTAPIYYAQASLEVGNTLLLSHNPPSAWDESLLGTPDASGLEGLRRRLLPHAGAELDALLVQFQRGSGKATLLQPKPLPDLAQPVASVFAAPVEEPAPVLQAAPAAFETLVEPVVDEAAAPVIEPPSALDEPGEPSEPREPAEIMISTMEPLPEPLAIPEEPATEFTPPPLASAQTWESFPPIDMTELPVSPEPLRATPASSPAPASAPVSTPASTPSRPARRRRSPQGAAAVLTVGRAFGTTYTQFSQSLGTFLNRMLPGDLPASIMAVTAVIIPLIVVTVAMVIYQQRGRSGEFERRYAEVAQAAQAAQAQTEPISRQQAWQGVLQLLADVEEYQTTQETQALRLQAQGAIDELNLAVRLDFQPAITEGLPSQTRVRRIVATDTDLYLLDSRNGTVWRGIYAGRGYDLDKTFQCGPGFQSSASIGPLVDIQLYAKPDGSANVLLGMDGSGGMMECAPGAPPIYIPLAPPPAGWKQPIAFTAHLGSVYVLDPQTKQVWVYRGGNFASPPDLFFDQNIPPLETVVDLTAGQEDLFLLHADGHITLCTIAGFGVSATQCNDPFPYQDSRPGRQGQALTPPTPFNELQAAPAPDPSLYLLEPGTPAIYHFSLRLAYQRQLIPQANLTTSGTLDNRAATAFALSPDRRVMFLAFDNEVVYAGLP